MNTFLFQLGQTSQQWYQEDPQKFLSWMTLYVALVCAFILAFFKVVNLIVDQYWGVKKNWQKHVDDSITALSKASSVSSTAPTPDDIEKIESNANGHQ